VEPEVRGQARRVERHALADEMWLSATPSQLKVARDYAREAAVAFGFDEDACYDFVYAVNEAVTNAIRHGAPDERGRIGLSVSSDAGRLTFVVRDSGTFLMPTRGEDAAGSGGGRGFALMARLVDEVLLRIEPRGTTVTLSKACASLCPP
jgi:anti-sigma regulatory factor (Ser/Thr protein kinase)